MSIHILFLWRPERLADNFYPSNLLTRNLQNLELLIRNDIANTIHFPKTGDLLRMKALFEPK